MTFYPVPLELSLSRILSRSRMECRIDRKSRSGLRANCGNEPAKEYPVRNHCQVGSYFEIKHAKVAPSSEIEGVM
jgi:hypothetical protein